MSKKSILRLLSLLLCLSFTISFTPLLAETSQNLFIFSPIPIPPPLVNPIIPPLLPAPYVPPIIPHTQLVDLNQEQNLWSDGNLTPFSETMTVDNYGLWNFWC